MKERRENVRTEKIEKEKIEKEKIEKEGTEYLEELELLEKEFKQRTLDMKIKYGEIPVPEAGFFLSRIFSVRLKHLSR